MKLNTPEHRSFLLQEEVKKLMRADRSMSYDEAWRTANALPEMAPVVAAMANPSSTFNASLSTQANFEKPVKDYATGPGVPKTRAERSAVIESAVAQLMGCGKSYDQAFGIVKNHPDTKAIFDGMDNPTDAEHLRDSYAPAQQVNLAS